MVDCCKILLWLCFALNFLFESSGLAQQSVKTQKDESNWSEYAFPSRIAAASFPSKPTAKVKSRKSQQGEIKTSEMVLLEKAKQRVMMLAVVQYPDAKQFDANRALTAMVESESKQGTVMSKKEIKTKDLNIGREVITKLANGMVFRTRIFIDPKGPFAYTCKILGTSEFIEGSEAKTFFDSFSSQPGKSVPAIELEK